MIAFCLIFMRMQFLLNIALISAFIYHQITDRKWLKAKGISFPLAEKPAQVKGTFQFEAPVDVCVSGSLVTDTMVMPDVEADLIMVVPKVSKI